jgi:hypothetical protein
MMSLGAVKIVCPVCERTTSIPFHVEGCTKRCDHEPAAPGTFCLGHVKPDMDAVYAHLLTHGPGDDGEPLPMAA